MNAHPQAHLLDLLERPSLVASMRAAVNGEGGVNFTQHRQHQSATRTGPTPVKKPAQRSTWNHWKSKAKSNWASYSNPND